MAEITTTTGIAARKRDEEMATSADQRIRITQKG